MQEEKFPYPNLSSKGRKEQIIETKTCKHCEAKFEITDKDLEFYEKVSPVFAGKKYKIPSPTLCPDCRFINRSSFINERKLYKRTCDATGKSIISTYSPDKPYKVYDSDIWVSNISDFISYGIEFDFSKSFFEQYSNLFRNVPRMSLDQGGNLENSTYNNYADNLKNCYMCINSIGCEQCYYDSYTNNSSNCIDCFISNENKECYECISCKNCYKLFFSRNCTDSKNSIFLSDCRNCTDCLFCVNLMGKQYYIFNKKYGKEEFLLKREELIHSIHTNKSKYFKEFEDFISDSVVKYANIFGSENCTGDDIFNSKNIKSSFLVNNSENVSYSFAPNEAVNCYDCDGLGIEKSYYTIITGGGSYECLFCIAGWENCRNLLYCDYCFFNCNNLFGCVGVKNKSYCILNKQYTKEEYEEIVPKIIEHMKKTGEWGEFFPSSISPFGYNETVANEYFPLDRRDVLSKHLYKWSDYEAPFPKVEKIIPADKLPENIADIPDDILNWAIECEVTKKPFRIIKQELDFYRKHNLPLPKRHPDQRHLDRMKLRNPRKLYDRKCDKCGKNMKTTYAPDRKEIVYCEECYNKEVY